MEIDIFNIVGRKVKSMKIYMSKGTNNIEIKDIPNGIYFLKIGEKIFKTTIIR